jgi:hypothetical protein
LRSFWYCFLHEVAAFIAFAGREIHSSKRSEEYAVPSDRELFTRGGTQTAGFEVWVEPSDRLLRMHIWGVWEEAVARAYEGALDARYPVFKGEKFSVICDVLDAPIQIPEVKEIRGRCVAKAIKAGMDCVAYLARGSLMPMQMRSMASGSGAQVDCFSSERDAREWIALQRASNSPKK